jgi:hypothetical protein
MFLAEATGEAGGEEMGNLPAKILYGGAGQTSPPAAALEFTLMAYQSPLIPQCCIITTAEAQESLVFWPLDGAQALL